MNSIMKSANHPSRPAPDFLPDRSYAVHEDDMSTIKNLKHCMSYVWLKNNKQYWFYPSGFDDNFMYGHLWDDGRWINVRIPMNNIESYY